MSLAFASRLRLWSFVLGPMLLSLLGGCGKVNDVGNATGYAGTGGLSCAQITLVFNAAIPELATDLQNVQDGTINSVIFSNPDSIPMTPGFEGLLAPMIVMQMTGAGINTSALRQDFGGFIVQTIPDVIKILNRLQTDPTKATSTSIPVTCYDGYISAENSDGVLVSNATARSHIADPNALALDISAAEINDLVGKNFPSFNTSIAAGIVFHESGHLSTLLSDSHPYTLGSWTGVYGEVLQIDQDNEIVPFVRTIEIQAALPTPPPAP